MDNLKGGVLCDRARTVGDVCGDVCGCGWGECGGRRLDVLELSSSTSSMNVMRIITL